MVNPFIHTPAEKEECVLEMSELGHSYPQIMKECHVSPNTISSIKKKIFGATDKDYFQAGKISKETQAFKLFQQGKSLIDVKTEIDADSGDVIEYHKRYQELRGADMYNTGYDKVKGNIQPYLHLMDLMNSLGMTPEHVAQLAGHGIRLPFVWDLFSKLCNDVQILESQKRYLGFQLNDAHNQLQQYKATLDFYHRECEAKKNELLALDYEINARKKFIQSFDNDQGYIRIKEAAKNETKLLIQDNYISSAITLSATIEAIRRYPDNQRLIFDITSYQNNPTMPNAQAWIDSHKPQLLQFVENVQNQIAEQITEATVNSVKLIQQHTLKT